VKGYVKELDFWTIYVWVFGMFVLGLAFAATLGIG
jgi:hypothetical protein